MLEGPQPRKDDLSSLTQPSERKFTAAPFGYTERLLAGQVESTFFEELGVVDTGIVDHITAVAQKSIRYEKLMGMDFNDNKPFSSIEDILKRAIATHDPNIKRNLLITGGDLVLYANAVCDGNKSIQKFLNLGTLPVVSAVQLGKKFYYDASSIEQIEVLPEGAVLKRLSGDFELCVYGLGKALKDFLAIG